MGSYDNDNGDAPRSIARRQKRVAYSTGSLLFCRTSIVMS
jgi:hypothetical protein